LQKFTAKELARDDGGRERFTGGARMGQVDENWKEDVSSRMLLVEFEPGARTNWHTHRGQQVIIVTSGEGRVQVRGEQPIIIRPGDVVVCNAGETHWHGAAPDSEFSHLAVTQGSIDWLEPVED
jgi:quercetin dioxygenase-like cupin family protein